MVAPVYTTVIGQCMGARNTDEANFYFKRLNKITRVLSILWNALIFAITPLIVCYSAASSEAKDLVIWLVLINNIFNGLFYKHYLDMVCLPAALPLMYGARFFEA